MVKPSDGGKGPADPPAAKLIALYHMICSKGKHCACRMSIPRVGYKLDTNSPFCHLCMTAVHKIKWLPSTKKVGPSHAIPSLSKFLPGYRKEATAILKSAKLYSQCYEETDETVHLFP